HFPGSRYAATAANKPSQTMAMSTTQPNDVTKTVHDRMPVILPPPAFSSWLDSAIGDPLALRPLLVPYPPDDMEAHPANPAMNRPGFEGPECLVLPETAA